MVSPPLPTPGPWSFWYCSTNRPVARTLLPLTIRPCWAVLTVQPTVPELPWSARQAQMSSIRVLLALTTRLLVACPAMSPPIRKNVSWTEIGLLAWFADEPAGPICSSVLELVVPASNRRPSIRTPFTSATCMVSTPPTGMRVGMPMPSTTVLGVLTLMVWLMLAAAGVKKRLHPWASAALICAAVSDGVATKNWLIGTDVPGGGPFAPRGPGGLGRRDGARQR